MTKLNKLSNDDTERQRHHRKIGRNSRRLSLTVKALSYCWAVIRTPTVAAVIQRRSHRRKICPASGTVGGIEEKARFQPAPSSRNQLAAAAKGRQTKKSSRSRSASRKPRYALSSPTRLIQGPSPDDHAAEHRSDHSEGQPQRSYGEQLFKPRVTGILLPDQRVIDREQCGDKHQRKADIRQTVAKPVSSTSESTDIGIVQLP